MWYYEINNEQQGPVEESEIQTLLASGSLNATSMVWREGQESWLPIAQVPEFASEAPAEAATAVATPAPQAAAQQPAQMGSGTLPPPTSGLAITSMILGIVSFPALFLCAAGFAFSLPAVICGHIARSKIRKSNGAQTGNGLALAGLITGYINLVCCIGFLIVIIFAFQSAAGAAEEIKNSADEAALEYEQLIGEEGLLPATEESTPPVQESY